MAWHLVATFWTLNPQPIKVINEYLLLIGFCFVYGVSLLVETLLFSMNVVVSTFLVLLSFWLMYSLPLSVQMVREIGEFLGVVWFAILYSTGY